MEWRLIVKAYVAGKKSLLFLDLAKKVGDRLQVRVLEVQDRIAFAAGKAVIGRPPERVLEMCSQQRMRGEDVALDKAYWEACMDEMAGRGQRLFGQRPAHRGLSPERAKAAQPGSEPEAEAALAPLAAKAGGQVLTLGQSGEGSLVKAGRELPADFEAIQLLPIWEPGVVKSLYGIAGWNLNYEFFSDELYEYAPNLDTIEKQLRATTNLLHVIGKSVGMDVIPHTDRFSEMALGTPDLFEWMKVRDRQIVDHSDGVAAEAERAVLAWLHDRGPAVDGHGAGRLVAVRGAGVDADVVDHPE